MSNLNNLNKIRGGVNNVELCIIFLFLKFIGEAFMLVIRSLLPLLAYLIFL